MKVEKNLYETKIIYLRAENDEEQVLLNKLTEEGIMVGGSGSTLMIQSPKIADLTPLYLDRDELGSVMYALGYVANILGDNPDYKRLLVKLGIIKD